MILILDSGGVTAVATRPDLLATLRQAGLWPPRIPAVVLAEALTGDHRRDFHTNRLLRSCQIRDVDEPMCREAARLRVSTRRAGKISATDAIVVAFASHHDGAVVLTSDPRDLTHLAEHARQSVAIRTT